MMAQKSGPGGKDGMPTPSSPTQRRARQVQPRTPAPGRPSWLIQRMPVLLLGAALLIALLITWRLRGSQSDLAGIWHGEGPSGAALTLNLEGSDDSLSGTLAIPGAPNSPYRASARRQPDSTLVIAYAVALPSPFSGGWTCTLEDAANLSCADGIRNLIVLTRSQSPPR